MRPKPIHLEPQYAALFKESSVVEADKYRTPYPSEIFSILSELMTDEPKAVLDVGCGTGLITRNLMEFVDRG